MLAITGRPISEQQGGGEGRPPFRILKLVAAPGDRAILHARIARRLKTMMQEGFLDELRRLRARPGLTASHSSMRAVGYRQLALHLDGELGLDEAVEKAVFATRQLAKRQLTWLRAMPWRHAVACDDPGAPEHLVALARRLVG